MNSEKVKEIKKALEYAIDMGLVIGKNTMFVNIKLVDILTLINELEKCSEKWQKLCADEVELNTPLKERIKELKNENKSLQDLCNKTYEDLTKEIDRLENRVQELENGIAKSMLGCEFLPECTNEKLKEFAEKVAKRLININGIKQILDETLKEFIGE